MGKNIFITLVINWQPVRSLLAWLLPKTCWDKLQNPHESQLEYATRLDECYCLKLLEGFEP